MEDRHYAARISLEKWNELLEDVPYFSTVGVYAIFPEEGDPDDVQTFVDQFVLTAGEVKKVISGQNDRVRADIEGSGRLWSTKELLENVVEVTVVSE